jgi:hypothetical protein
LRGKSHPRVIRKRIEKTIYLEKGWLLRHSIFSDRRRLRFEAAAAARRQGMRRLKVFMQTQEGQRQAWAARRTPMPENFWNPIMSSASNG